MPTTFAGVRHYIADCQTTSLAVKRRPRRYDVGPTGGRRYSRLSPLTVPVVDGRLGRGAPLNLAGPSIVPYRPATSLSPGAVSLTSTARPPVC